MSVITANPKTAGVARWNFLALWGHRAKQGDKAATNYCTNVRCRVNCVLNNGTCCCSLWAPFFLLGHVFGHTMSKAPSSQHVCSVVMRLQVFKRVVIQPRDAREASDTFLRQSIADVLLTYENEIVLTNTIQPSSAMPYIAPDNNVLVRFSSWVVVVVAVVEHTCG